ALLRQARMVLDNEHGTNLPDDAFVATLCHAVLDRAPATEPTGRAKFQIALTVCQRCRQGWQEGAGAQIPIDPAAVDRAMCDAQHIGSIDGPASERAYQDIAPSVARLVWRRDGGRCRVDGCRSARGLELHHIIHRADGGSHDASNIILCCSRCHQSHHAGLLTISGTAEQLVIRRVGQGGAGAADPSPPNTNAIMNTSARVGASASTMAAIALTGSTDATSSAACAHVGAADVMVPIRTAVVTADVSDASANTATYADAADAAASISRTRAHVRATGPTTPIESASAGHLAVSPTPRAARTRVESSETQREPTEVAAESNVAGATASIACARAHVGA